MDEIKAEKTISDHYLTDKGKAYFDQRSVETMAFGRVFQTRYLRPFCSENAVLLDFGCSDGLFLRNLPAHRRIGVDGSPYVLEECTRICQKTGIPIELHESLDNVKNSCVDVVISNHTLEHVPNPLYELKHMRRVLQPGGRLVLVTPFDDLRDRRNYC